MYESPNAPLDMHPRTKASHASFDTLCQSFGRVDQMRHAALSQAFPGLKSPVRGILSFHNYMYYNIPLEPALSRRPRTSVKYCPFAPGGGRGAVKLAPLRRRSRGERLGWGAEAGTAPARHAWPDLHPCPPPSRGRASARPGSPNDDLTDVLGEHGGNLSTVVRAVSHVDTVRSPAPNWRGNCGAQH